MVVVLFYHLVMWVCMNFSRARRIVTIAGYVIKALWLGALLRSASDGDDTIAAEESFYWASRPS